jgi:putative transposase
MLRGAQTGSTATSQEEESGFAESLNRLLRDEFLSREVLWGVDHAQPIVATWWRAYNEGRPHGALGYRTPAEVAQDSSANDARTGP